MREILNKVSKSKYWLMIIFISQFLVLRNSDFEWISNVITFFVALLLYLNLTKIFVMPTQEYASNIYVSDNSLRSERAEKSLLLATNQYLNTESIAKVHYALHLINPKQSLKAKLDFALGFLNEILPDKILSFYYCEKTQINFISATRTNADNQVISVEQQDETISDVSAKLKLVLNVNNNSQRYNFIREISIKSEDNDKKNLLMPVHFFGELTGVLGVINTTFKDLTQFELSLIESFCEGLAILLHNHVLFNAPTVYEQEPENQIAKRIVKDLFPKSPPILKKWETSYFVSNCENYTGDFYDHVFLPNDELMVIIGKSTANNISGALFFDRLKIMIRCLTQSNLSPSELLNKLSYNLNFDSTCDTFATVSVLLLSKDGKMATICCAGSPHPIVIRSRSGFAEIIQTDGGIPLGLFDRSGETYKDIILHLIPGDGIFLYTEGLLNHVNKKNEHMNSETIKIELEKMPEQKCEDILCTFSKYLQSENDSKGNSEEYVLFLAKTEQL